MWFRNTGFFRDHQHVDESIQAARSQLILLFREEVVRYHGNPRASRYRGKQAGSSEHASTRGAIGIPIDRGCGCREARVWRCSSCLQQTAKPLHACRFEGQATEHDLGVQFLEQSRMRVFKCVKRDVAEPLVRLVDCRQRVTRTPAMVEQRVVEIEKYRLDHRVVRMGRAVIIEGARVRRRSEVA